MNIFNYFLPAAFLEFLLLRSQSPLVRPTCLVCVLLFEFLLYLFILRDVLGFIFQGRHSTPASPWRPGKSLDQEWAGLGETWLQLLEMKGGRKRLGAFVGCTRTHVATLCYTPVIWLRRFPDIRPIGKSQPGRFRFKQLPSIL